MDKTVGVVFDLDNTLYDSSQFVLAGFKEICTNINMDVLEGMYNSNPDNVMARFNRAMFRRIKPKLKLYDWVIPLFEKLTCPIGLITMGDRQIQQNKIEALYIQGYFDYIMICKTKTHELKIMQDVLNVDKCVYVGDRVEDQIFAENNNAFYIDVKADKFIERIMYCVGGD